MKNTVKIVGAIVDKHRITLYFPDGTKELINQGDSRIPFILSEIVPAIKRLGYYEGKPPQSNNPYAEYENKSGIVKFFAIARDKVASWFSNEPMKEESVGDLNPTTSETQDTSVARDDDEDGLNEIMEHAVSVQDDSFDPTEFNQSKDLSGNTDNGLADEKPTEKTIIAKVGNKIIPDIEKLQTYIKTSNINASQEGLNNFLARIAEVIDERKHSIEDLLRFMELAELPIANDGRIIVYKLLNKREEGHFVDCHTGRVKQWVGSIVETDVTNVDPDRRRDCSNGLHIARRSYLRQFIGNACVLCYVDPKDVIAVPEGTGNKMRVARYTIAAELTPDQKNTVVSNKNITSTQGGNELLSAAVTGLLPKPTQLTRILDSNGHNIKYTRLSSDNTSNTSNTPTESTSDVGTIDDMLGKEKQVFTAQPLQVEDVPKPEVKPDVAVTPPVDTTKTEPKKEVVKPKKKAKAKPSNKPLSPRAQILAILSKTTPSTITDEEAAQVLVLKKKAKKGWVALGVSEEFIAFFTK